MQSVYISATFVFHLCIVAHFFEKASPILLPKGGIFLRPTSKKALTGLSLFLICWLSFRFLLPLTFPFLLGLALAIGAEPVVSFLEKRCRLPRGIGTAIGVTMTFCFLAMLILLLCAFLVREITLLAAILPDMEGTLRSGTRQLQSWLLDLSTHAPQAIQPLLTKNVTTLLSDGTNLLDKILRYFLSLAGNLLSHVPDSALSLGTAVLSAFLISAKLPRLRRWLKRWVDKEKRKPLLDTFRRIRTALGSWLLAQSKLMGITLLLLLSGFFLLRIPYAPLWALGVCLVDAFPILGTGTILLPWALLSFLRQDIPRAIGLLGIYITVTLTRSILEPKLVGRHLGLDPLVTLMALYAGFKLWGIGGMLIAPLLAVTALQIVPERNTR